MLRRIGAGAYGEVWLARNTATQAERAVKIVYRSTFAEERPFQREFEGIKSFDAVSRSHPTQLALFHVGKGDGFFYYVMELADPLPGASEYRPHTLRADLEDGRLPAAKVLELGQTLAEALHHLHAAGLIHRDVKPSNIIYVKGRPKLADIGLVTDASDSQSIVGTEGYLPPEGPGTPHADIYALGKVLYEALTGFHRRRFPELPSEMRKWEDTSLAFELNAIIVKACAGKTEERHPSASSMLEEFKFIEAGRSIKRKRCWQAAIRHGWRLGLVGSAPLICILVLIWYREAKVTPQAFRYSTNQLANQEYVFGVKSMLAIGPEVSTNAIYHLERAVAEDPNFAEAWARLAWVCINSPETPSKQRNAKAAAEKAVALNPKLSAGHAFLASARMLTDRDWVAAEKERKLALKLNPVSEEILLESALNLAVMGRRLEAVAFLEKALRMDPDSASFYRLNLAGLVYCWCGHYDQAIRFFEQVPVQEPHVRGNLAAAYIAKGDYKAALAVRRAGVLDEAKDSRKMTAKLDALEQAFEQKGAPGYWEQELAFASAEGESPMLMAAICARLKRTEDAVKFIIQAKNETPSDFQFKIYTDSSFDTIRADSRIRALTDQLWKPTGK